MKNEYLQPDSVPCTTSWTQSASDFDEALTAKTAGNQKAENAMDTDSNTTPQSTAPNGGRHPGRSFKTLRELKAYVEAGQRENGPWKYGKHKMIIMTGAQIGAARLAGIVAEPGMTMAEHSALLESHGFFPRSNSVDGGEPLASNEEAD